MPRKPVKPPRFTFRNRTAGLLLHPTSLPGPHGSGDLGDAAFRFADFLADAGMTWWQMLPVNPPDPIGAPYSAYSAFAGSPQLVSLDRLVQDGLLRKSDVRPSDDLDATRVRHAAVMRFRLRALRCAFMRFEAHTRGKLRDEYEQFCESEAAWLGDYALFGALRTAHRGRSWFTWDMDLRLRRRAALHSAAKRMQREIAFERFVQFLFHRQWLALKRYCTRRGVGLIGDIPIFVGYDSSDVWAHRELFMLDAAGRPKLISGVPPDSFSATGQLWHHPLYNWRRHEAGGFAWWIERFRATLELFDAVRIDHFLGFSRCWAVRGNAKTAERGRWLPSPGEALFAAVKRALGTIEVIAEDLGVLTPQAAALRDRFHYPGMRLLHAAFGPGSRYHQPHNHPRQCVAYPGTHDNDTTVGWFQELRRRRRQRDASDGLSEFERVLHYANSDGREIHWDMIRLTFGSPANTAIVPVQDVLGLDSSARTNVPASRRGNWSWRMAAGDLKATHAQRLRRLVATYERMA